ncbi:Acetyl-coenzyme A carboxylase carboxyl transferase subunit alpha [Budvicia aquatica]|uniref:Acetyl-coenzyme A carboxylase carboxyl transferase subunit alpha n=1 Tax=Budvicia aquatica TaxID=82979 RepID=A0A484ZY86_9GAMM|nr:Acetyl-coenzyme A carboxylase carboxyl transferase subunit alpha [Budvicia aquatica]
MSLNFLDFEQPIAELEAKIDSLTAISLKTKNWILTSMKRLSVYVRKVLN